jgi:hypothetical protein
MTSKERLTKVLNGEIPDHVPVAPDTSNMIPARLVGKPFWEIYLYQDPPIWKAYIDCVKHFGFDSLMDGYAPILFEDLGELDNTRHEVIIYKDSRRIVTQKYRMKDGRKEWEPYVTVYYDDNPPTAGLNPHALGFSMIPDTYEEVEDRKEWPQGEELLRLVKQEMGDHGLVGVWCGTTKLLNNERDIYDYYDNPGKYRKKKRGAACILHPTI